MLASAASMDALAFLIAAIGVGLAANGYLLAGMAISVGALFGLASALARERRLVTILPFSFASYFVVLFLCFVAAVVLRRHAAAILGLFGSFIYYYGCVSLSERKYRYVPWGAGLGLSWRTVEKTHRPIVYWILIAICFLLAGIFLGSALGVATGWFPLQSHF